MAVGNKFHYSRCLSESAVIRINLSEFQEWVHTHTHLLEMLSELK